jgi:hypothetical protein
LRGGGCRRCGCRLRGRRAVQRQYQRPECYASCDCRCHFACAGASETAGCAPVHVLTTTTPYAAAPPRQSSETAPPEGALHGPRLCCAPRYDSTELTRNIVV